MGAFELDRERGRERGQDGIGELAENSLDGCDSPSPFDRRRIREECIVAFKVYDHCRHPYCS